MWPHDGGGEETWIRKIVLARSRLSHWEDCQDFCRSGGLGDRIWGRKMKEMISRQARNKRSVVHTQQYTVVHSSQIENLP
jgi:hypothetical protein